MIQPEPWDISQVMSEQDELPSSVGLDFRARLDGGRMYSRHLEAKIDMVIKNLDLEPKVDAMMRISLRSFAILPGGKN
ncbi:hypothetical protein Tco_0923794 [Tanacetum coccineum]|uniref:Uncharacterized protein n=1 Tax=Tanacetum coccineum TaxID=301880 RepID=A0ABQ5D208_9ASTR